MTRGPQRGRAQVGQEEEAEGGPGGCRHELTCAASPSMTSTKLLGNTPVLPFRVPFHHPGCTFLVTISMMSPTDMDSSSSRFDAYTKVHRAISPAFSGAFSAAAAFSEAASFSSE